MRRTPPARRGKCTHHAWRQAGCRVSRPCRTHAAPASPSPAPSRSRFSRQPVPGTHLPPSQGTPPPPPTAPVSPPTSQPGQPPSHLAGRVAEHLLEPDLAHGVVVHELDDDLVQHLGLLACAELTCARPHSVGKVSFRGHTHKPPHPTRAPSTPALADPMAAAHLPARQHTQRLPTCMPTHAGRVVHDDDGEAHGGGKQRAGQALGHCNSGGHALRAWRRRRQGQTAR
jgi:hypothetical protein